MTPEEYMDARLAKSKTFADSVAAIDGTFVGSYFNYMLHAKSQADSTLNMNEVERGIRTVMASDTANVSYLLGLQVGMTIINTYKEIDQEIPVDKKVLMDAIMGALRLDSVSEEQVIDMRTRYEQTGDEVTARRQAELDRQIAETDEAKQNIMLGDACAAKLLSDPDYQQIGSTGIYCKVINPGSGDMLEPNQVVHVDYTIQSIEGQDLESYKDRGMYAGHAPNPLLANVLPLMRPGEEATFFIPYQQAYGAQGHPGAGIGPCQSLFVTVKVL